MSNNLSEGRIRGIKPIGVPSSNTLLILNLIVLIMEYADKNAYKALLSATLSGLLKFIHLAEVPNSHLCIVHEISVSYVYYIFNLFTIYLCSTVNNLG